MKISTNRHKWRVLLFILFAGILTGAFCAVLFWFKSPPPEPQYQGKKLTAWAREIDQMDFFRQPAFQQHREQNERAITVIQQVGTNALPVALSLLRAKDSWLRGRLTEWAERYDANHWPKHFPVQIQSAGEKNFEGINIIWALGAMAEPAIPDLIRLLQNQNRQAAETARLALPGVGTNAIPPLLKLLSAPDANIRLRAAIILGDFFRPKMPPAESGGSLMVAGSEDFRSQASVAVPVLLQSLDNRELNSVTHIRIIQALGWIREDAPVVVPALIRHIQSETNGKPDYWLHRNYFRALGSYETNAEAAVPLLISLLQPMTESSNNPAFVHFSYAPALDALQKIDPAAAKPFVAEWKAHLSDRPK